MQDHGEIVNSNTVRFERLLPGPVEQVWDFITGSEGIASWLFAEATFEQVQGGRVDLKFGTPDPENGHQYNVRGTVSEIEIPRLVTYSWIETSTDLTSTVRFELSPRGGDVLLTVTHSSVSPEFMPKVSAGWHAHLDTLVAVVKGEKPDEFLPVYTELLKRYSAAIAATIVLSSAVSPAIASSNDPAHKALNAQRQQLLNNYDRAWKDADDLKYKIEIVRKAVSQDWTRAQDDLEKELKHKYDDLRRIEVDIRDLDKALI